MSFRARRDTLLVGGEEKIVGASVARDAVIVASVTVRRAFDTRRRVEREISGGAFRDARAALDDVDERFGVTFLTARETVTFTGALARHAVSVASQAESIYRAVASGWTSCYASRLKQEVPAADALMISASSFATVQAFRMASSTVHDSRIFNVRVGELPTTATTSVNVVRHGFEFLLFVVLLGFGFDLVQRRDIRVVDVVSERKTFSSVEHELPVDQHPAFFAGLFSAKVNLADLEGPVADGRFAPKVYGQERPVLKACVGQVFGPWHQERRSKKRTAKKKQWFTSCDLSRPFIGHGVGISMFFALALNK